MDLLRMERRDQMLGVFVFQVLIGPFEIDTNLDDLIGNVGEN